VATYPKNVWIGEPPAEPCPDHDCADDDPCGEEGCTEGNCDSWQAALASGGDTWTSGEGWSLDNIPGTWYGSYASLAEAQAAGPVGGHKIVRLVISGPGTPRTVWAIVPNAETTADAWKKLGLAFSWGCDYEGGRHVWQIDDGAPRIESMLDGVSNYIAYFGDADCADPGNFNDWPAWTGGGFDEDW
jgi:hypothetical protein